MAVKEKKEDKIEQKQRVILENNILKIQKVMILNEKERVLSEECFPLSEVTEKEIYMLRIGETPGFILKKEGRYFYSTIPKNLKFFGQRILGQHCCSDYGSDCKYLYASKNGCPKVRDLSQEYYVRLGYKKQVAVGLAKRIEKYDFITLGYETVNTNEDFFVVAECKKSER